MLADFDREAEPLGVDEDEALALADFDLEAEALGVRDGDALGLAVPGNPPAARIRLSR